MSEFDAELAYFRQRISRQYEAELSRNGAVPPEAIPAALAADPFGMSHEGLAYVERHLRASLSVEQTLGISITSEYAPWLKSRSGEIDYFYWNRLKRFYLEGGSLPPHVVAILDQVTDEVLDYCGNPNDPNAWSRRGMVMGHVQSGKTTNYSALICKAADAGYKVIILLAGLTNSLRGQTQERLDETFIGRKSIFGSTIPERLPITRYATEHREPAFGTTRDADFGLGVSRYGVTVAALREPVIFVTKKNKSTLTNLRNWLTTQTRGGMIDYPLLLIDDEADNASVDTLNDPGRATAINQLIRDILKRFSRSSYVGYTATPFANIFINPDTVDQMLGDDLFPKHFIKALDPPNNYVGPQRVFNDDGDLKDTMIRVIDDYGDLLPLKHKKDDPLVELPTSMHQAIRAFVVARTIRVIRGDGSKHCSMMINVSRFNAVQEKVLGLTYTFLEQMRRAVNANAGLGPLAIKDAEIAALRTVLETEFVETEVEWNSFLAALPEAIRTIETRTVNMKGGELDYSRHKENGLHVIAIGGLALSRGLTLEGLVVSYILRNTAASDTLMQMARWFGYRPNFEDLCRLYLPRSSLDYYVEIDEAIEELREEIQRMRRLNQTPEQFGLKVRQSTTALRITAANKMQSATALRVAQDYSSRHVEGHMLVNDEAVNSSNRKAIQEFIRKLGKQSTSEAEPDERVRRQLDQHLVWRGVKGTDVLELIRNFRFPEAHPDLGPIAGNVSLFADYISDRTADELSSWDVLVLSLQNKSADTKTWPLEGADREVNLRSRDQGVIDPAGNLRITGSKNRVADPGDASLLLGASEREAVETNGKASDSNYCSARSRPLMLIHAVSSNLRPEGPGEQPSGQILIQEPAVSLSFCTPGTRIPAEERTYQVNLQYLRQLEAFAKEADDDDGMFDA